MSTYGQRTIATVGTSCRVSADGQPEHKVGGVTIDWTTVAAAVAATTLPDGVPIAVGDLFLRFGQVITKITLAGIDVITIDATGGTFKVTLASEIDGVTVTSAPTTAIAFNATAATLQTALRLLVIPGAALITVTGSAGGPYTLTFDASSGFVTVTTDATLLTGNTSTAAVSVTDTGGNIGQYGPYDPAATDGRALLVMGSIFIINRTVKFTDILSNHPEAIFGGQAFLARIIQSGVASHSLAAGPTLAELKTAFPRLHLITEAPLAG